MNNSENPNARMLIIPHSRGAIYTRNALIDSPQYLRNRVEVSAFAPAAYIDDRLCHRVLHYKSAGKRGGWLTDPVTQIDIEGRRRCKDTIITLKPHPDASMHDHGFRSPTFYKSQKLDIEKYLSR